MMADGSLSVTTLAPVPMPHAGAAPGAFSSADAVVPQLLDMVPASSVLDVGCGAGAWLSAFVKHGVDDVVGVDGAYARPHLVFDSSRFVEADLTQPLHLGRRFDLVVSLEVAEHLPPQCAGEFVASLARHGDLVLFSAAIPGQGGPGHVNMQWPSYWTGLFADQGLVAADVVRDEIRNDERVSWWYRQNMLLFGSPARLRATGIEPHAPGDWARPEVVESILASTSSSVRAAARSLIGAIRQGIRRSVGRAIQRIGLRP